jgi:hypothetical protein
MLLVRWLPWFQEMLAARLAIASTPYAFRRASSAPVVTETDSGTSCRRSMRLRLWTVTASRAGASLAASAALAALAAGAAAAGASAAWTANAPLSPSAAMAAAMGARAKACCSCRRGERLTGTPRCRWMAAVLLRPLLQRMCQHDRYANAARERTAGCAGDHGGGPPASMADGPIPGAMRDCSSRSIPRGCCRQSSR